MRSIVKRPVAVAAAFAAGLAVLLAAAPEAAAQSFFQQLFGIGTPPPPPSQSSPVTPGGRPYNFPSGPISPRRPSPDDDEDRPAKGGGLKTVCVRMCDGYFFPVSNSTSKKGLYRDQMKCRSACGDEARLFHLPANATDIADATDGQGRVYGLLPSAFKYRKTMVAGCQCRPVPWSEAELGRHQRYAEVEAEKTAAEQAQAAKLAAAAPAPGKPSTPKADSKVAAATSTAATQEPGKADDTVADPVEAPVATVAAATTAKAKPTKTAASNSPTRTTPRRMQPPTTIAQGPKPLPPAMGLGAGQFSWPGDSPKRQ